MAERLRTSSCRSGWRLPIGRGLMSVDEMRAIRTLIVDDELAGRDGIRHLLAADPEVVVAGECANGRDAAAAIRDVAPDLVFLDVQMPELDGFEVLREVGVERAPAIVFVTAFDQYALRAFDVHAIDYLLKPFTDERFRQSLERAKLQVRHGRLGELSQKLAASWATESRRGRLARRTSTDCSSSRAER